MGVNVRNVSLRRANLAANKRSHGELHCESAGEYSMDFAVEISSSLDNLSADTSGYDIGFRVLRA